MIRKSLRQSVLTYIRRGIQYSSGLFPKLKLPLTHSIVPLIGSSTPTFLRDTSATVVDFEGVIQDCLINEARFEGARRVQNLCSDSEVYTTETLTVYSGIDYIFSFEGSGSVKFSGAATGTLSGSGRPEATLTTSSTSLKITVTGEVLKAQFEKISGTQTAASEYVSTGVLSYPYHGAGVDGVKYFNTDRDGNLLTDIKGLVNEPNSENIILYSEQFDNPAWYKNTNVTLSADATTAPNGTITAGKYNISDSKLRNIDAAIEFENATTYTFSIWIKAIVDTVFYLRQAQAEWVESFNIYAADGWVRLTSTHTTTTSGVYNFGFFDNSGGTGDRFYIWGAQLEKSAFPTSYIKTEATVVTRTPDSLIIDNSNRDVLPNSFCLVGTWTPLGGGDDYVNADVRLFGSQDSRGNETRTYGLLSSYDYAQDGTLFSISREDITEGIENKYAFQVFQDELAVNAEIYKDGVQKRGETQTQTLDHSNESLELGSWNGIVFASYIKDIKIYNKELSDSQLKRITA